MRYSFLYTLIVLAFVACVPIARYNTLQNELRNAQESNQLSKVKYDSLGNGYKYLKADYNSLRYELEETQRYASFSDLELVKELNKQKSEKNKLAEIVNQIETNKAFAAWRGTTKAQAFATDAQCLLSSFSEAKFIILNDNKVVVDIEGLLANSKERSIELKAALVDLFSPIQKRSDWAVTVSLYQSGTNTDWHKITLQNEMLGFLVSEIALPSAYVQSSTKIITQEKSLEFGFRTDSRLLLEVQFKG